MAQQTLLPISWMSPLTEPITTTPLKPPELFSRSGSTSSSAAVIAMDAAITCGRYIFPPLKSRPTCSMPLPRPLSIMISGSIPAFTAARAVLRAFAGSIETTDSASSLSNFVSAVPAIASTSLPHVVRNWLQIYLRKLTTCRRGPPGLTFRPDG